MTHIAIQEALNGKPVDWMEHVSEEQYRKYVRLQGRRTPPSGPMNARFTSQSDIRRQLFDVALCQ
jgi:hypothetical protein